MSKTKFTEGPWEVWGSTVIDQKGNPVAQCFRDIEANVNLIACAPEMYKLLEALYWCHNLDGYEEDVKNLLAIARGEASDE